MGAEGLADNGEAEAALSPEVLDLLRAAVSGPEPAGLPEALVAIVPRLHAIAAVPADGTPYSRRKIHVDDDLEVMLAAWVPGQRCAPHDHGGSHGYVALVEGTFDERRFAWHGDRLEVVDEAHHEAPGAIAFGPEVIHDMVAPAGGLSLHAYSPVPEHMNVFDLDRHEVLDLVGDFGAWIPDGDHPRTDFAQVSPAAATADSVDSVDPVDAVDPGSYDPVAELYDRAYVDITVREAEWRWVTRHVAEARAELGRPLRIVEVGCGNGALLRALDDRGDLESGVGFDDSLAQVARAIDRSEGRTRLRFDRIDGPHIDLPDASVDVVLSFLSFRYLDWEPILAEVRRVLAPGGHLWVVDMGSGTLRASELPLAVSSAWTHYRMPKRHPQFDKDLHALTSHPDWATMLRHNPIRPEAEYRAFLEGQFPGRRLQVLTVSRTQRVFGFDSGPVSPAAPPASA